MSLKYKAVTNDDIYNVLKDEILNLHLLPGQMISENEISQRFNVSRTPVKMAFLRLMSEKFIQIAPQKGTFVTLLDIELIKEIIYMRTTLELDVIKQLLVLTNNGYIAMLERNLNEQTELVSKQDIDPEMFYKLDNSFHEIIFDAVGKTKLWNIIQEFQVYYTRFRMLDVLNTGNFLQLLNEHQNIYLFLKEKDLAKIEKEVYNHLHGNLKRLSEKISNEFKNYFT